ncbi:MAG: MDR family oxidoreductase [Pseudomonadota bacterium]
MSDFKALVMRKDDQGQIVSSVEQLVLDDLPAGDVLVKVEYSTLNYKDGMIVNGNQGRLVRTFPHVPGIDFAGRVERSADPRFQPGDAVILTGWRVGEVHWGGYSQYARVQGDWLVPCPATLDTMQAMAVGTAGFTAMLAVLALEEDGLEPGQGPVLVTGAAGGVGSIAVSLLSRLGYSVSASTGRREQDAYLRELGATEIIDRQALNEAADGPLEKERWAGCIDSVGGKTLSRLLGQIRYLGSVAACGLAGGAGLNATVLPFLLRGVTLIGIDSVMCPQERRARAWARISTDLDLAKLATTISMTSLDHIPEQAAQILQGKIRGRLVVDLAD